MSGLRDRTIVVLLVVNVILATALVLTQVSPPAARAQVSGALRGSGYMMIPGAIRSDQDTLWVVKLGTGELTNVYFDRNQGFVPGTIVEIPTVRPPSMFGPQPGPGAAPGAPGAGAAP